MKDLIRYAAIMGLVLFVILRSDSVDTDAGSIGNEIIAGALTELSETNVESTVQYLTLRDQAIDRLRSELPKGTFKPPLWFVAELGKIKLDTPVPEAQRTFLEVSKRLYSKQKGEYFERGRKAVRDLLKGPDDVVGKCPDCKGTGKVGDGRVFTECLACGGDGIIDDSDRKEEVPVVETSNQESAGDQISRGPACDNAGGSCGSTAPRVVFPRLKRLFGR
jgi:hypothetical protein